MEHYADQLIKLIKNKSKTFALKFTIECPNRWEETSMGCYAITFIPTFKFNYLGGTKVFSFEFLFFSLEFWFGDVSELT